MDRRGFIGRLLAGGFGLGVGQAVSVQPVEAKIETVPGILPPLKDVLLTQVTMNMIEPSRLRQSLRGDHLFYRGKLEHQLEVRFEGDGCPELYRLLSAFYESQGLGRGIAYP